jgi:nucleoside 2-deoxyribosyltransferase
MKKIYLSAPYTIHPKACFMLANRKAAELMMEGNIVFSPISHSHPIAIQENMSNAHEFWMQQDLPFIEFCDELYVLQLEHWETSKGVQKEIEYATELGKPIKYILP